MFVLSNKPTYKFKVVVKRPSEAGAWESIDFTAEFKRRSRPEIEAMVAKGLPPDAEILATELVGWSDIKQPDGSPLEVNEANRVALLAEPFVQTAIVLAWLESAVKGPAKN
jgi:hypothetical protein